ncbi:MAG: hypothetical protein HDT13_11965 [Butyrivibrio sp.]|nr:hypothetical protein [Butyrivibrio sp.]
MVNGVTGQTTVDAQYSEISKTVDDASKKTSEEAKASSKDAYAEEGVVYEKSSDYKSIASMSKSDRSNIIAQLKADADARTEQMRQLVEKMMYKQAGAANPNSKSTWQNLLRKGLITDKEAIANAQADIAEDGYWGANQTSDRILSFATALSGGDRDKMEKMLAAFEKGFKQATKSWGSKLPDLCQDTYKAVHDKFDSWFEENGSKTSKTSD